MLEISSQLRALTPLLPDHTRAVKFWAVYNILEICPKGWSRQVYGAILDPQETMFVYYSRSRQRGVRFSEIWEREIIPPAGIQNGCWHGAVDISPSPKGFLAPVYAMWGGIVTYCVDPQPDDAMPKPTTAYLNGGRIGIEIEVNGYKSWLIYQHVNPCVIKDQEVRQGEVIGHLYDLEENSHLHLEMYSMDNLWSPLQLKRGYTDLWSFKYTSSSYPQRQWTTRAVPDAVGIPNVDDAYIYNPYLFTL